MPSYAELEAEHLARREANLKASRHANAHPVFRPGSPEPAAPPDSSAAEQRRLDAEGHAKRVGAARAARRQAKPIPDETPEQRARSGRLAAELAEFEAERDRLRQAIRKAQRGPKTELTPEQIAKADALHEALSELHAREALRLEIARQTAATELAQRQAAETVGAQTRRLRHTFTRIVTKARRNPAEPRKKRPPRPGLKAEAEELKARQREAEALAATAAQLRAEYEQRRLLRDDAEQDRLDASLDTVEWVRSTKVVAREARLRSLPQSSPTGVNRPQPVRVLSPIGDLKTGSTTLNDAAPTAIPAVPIDHRISISLRNRSASRIFIGGADLTLGNGALLDIGETWPLDVGTMTVVYGMSEDAAADVNWIELAA